MGVWVFYMYLILEKIQIRIFFCCFIVMMRWIICFNEVSMVDVFVGVHHLVVFRLGSFHLRKSIQRKLTIIRKMLLDDLVICETCCKAFVRFWGNDLYFLKSWQELLTKYHKLWTSMQTFFFEHAVFDYKKFQFCIQSRYVTMASCKLQICIKQFLAISMISSNYVHFMRASTLVDNVSKSNFTFLFLWLYSKEIKFWWLSKKTEIIRLYAFFWKQIIVIVI